MRPHEPPALPSQVKQDIKIVVDYLWHDEERHYRESDYDRRHIFRVLKRLAMAVKEKDGS